MTFVLAVFSTCSAQADHCPDSITVDKLLPGTTIEMTSAVQLDEYYRRESNPQSESSAASWQKTKIYSLRWSGGKKYRGDDYFVQTTMRSVGVLFSESKAKDEEQYLKGEIPPFKCILKKPLSTEKEKVWGRSVLEFEMDMKNNCPITSMTFDRPEIDFNYIANIFTDRTEKMTLGSLRYNLGSKFMIQPVCEQKAGSAVSNTLEKPPNPFAPLPASQSPPGKTVKKAH